MLVISNLIKVKKILDLWKILQGFSNEFIFVHGAIIHFALIFRVIKVIRYYLALLDMWSQITEIVAPWIQPLDNNGQVLSPWINSDAPLATTFFHMFTEILLELYEQFKGNVQNKYN